MLRIILLLCALTTIGIFPPLYSPLAANISDQEFKGKLSELLHKTEKSIKIIREQVIQSQNAPFLPDLYLQLGDLLSQKATTLYYIQMESSGGATGPTQVSKDSPVIVAQKEAIQIYQTLLKDFPIFPKRADVLYKLALSFKSIDEIPGFIQTASKLVKEFPKTDESMKASILLGQHFFENNDFPQALTLFREVAASSFNYERNLARYRIGLILLAQEKFTESLTQFEAVINDPDLKEQDNPYDLSKKAKGPKSDLKREALIDSIRDYTKVFEKNPDPVAYYSKLCPTEAHFQEIVEKLAMRYVMLKNYKVAVHLLRTATERMPDPQRIISIYREALLMIPIQDRTAIAIEEIDFLLQKLNLWMSYYEIAPKDLTNAYGFFEKQVRDLATTSHSYAKAEKDPTKKTHYLVRARDFYILYLGFFGRTPNAAKMAANLADTYFALKDYFNSGDYYFRTCMGEFGAPTEKKVLMENAILCLQKEPTGSFYERIRTKGLLLKSIQTYFILVPTAAKDPKLVFLMRKTEYEQGFFPDALNNLYGFIKNYRAYPQALDAGELILDYFNTRNDFAGLELWSDRLLSLHLPKPAFNAKLVLIKKQAKAHVVQEKIRTVAGFDEFSQGKSYLSAALSSSDPALKNSALQEALAKSKRESDIQTYLQAAGAMASRESDKFKKTDIFRSIILENLKIGRFYTGLAAMRKHLASSDVDPKSKVEILQQSVDTAVLLHDPQTLEEQVRSSNWSMLPQDVRNRARDQISDMLDSPINLPSSLVTALFRLGLSDETLLSIFKSQYKLASSIRNKLHAEVQSRCPVGAHQPVCRWNEILHLDDKKSAILKYLENAPTDLTGIESNATRFMGVATAYQSLEGSGDAQLEIATSLRGRELYTGFGTYLTRVANAHADLKNELLQKAHESLSTAQTYTQRCGLIIQKSTQINPAQRFCGVPNAKPTLQELTTWPSVSLASPARSDSNDDQIQLLQKAVFGAATDPTPLLNLTTALYKLGLYHHSSALSSYGSGVFKSNEGDFKAVLGCSAVALGFYNEGIYQLGSASDYLGMKTKCLTQSRNLWNK